MRRWCAGSLFAFATITLTATISLPGTASAQVVRSIPLPAELHYPEGIGHDGTGHVFTASARDGTVVRTALKDGESTVLVKGGVLLPPNNEIFPRMLGMKVDGAKRLWIMGGRTGKIFVLDSTTGKLIKEMAVAGEGSVLNDAIIAGEAVYVTDTLRPILWRVAINGKSIGDPEPWLSFDGTPLRYGPGRNINGIAAGADGKTLIVIQMDKGLLFKIDVATREVSPIDIGGEAVSGGDGLVLDGTTLYLVRQPEGEVATFSLTPDLNSGQLVSRFKHPALKWPATAAKIGNELIVVNSQFNRRSAQDPILPFELAAIPVSALHNK